jgi:hypothetical protein
MRSTLLKYLQRRHAIAADFPEYGSHGLNPPVAIRLRTVDHMNQQVGGRHFLERGAERRDQLVRQSVDEADRIGHHQLPRIRQLDLAQHRIERDEQRIGRGGAGARQRLNSVVLPAFV